MSLKLAGISHRLKIDMEALRKDVEQYPDVYLKERAVRFDVSSTGIRYALRRLQVTCKSAPLG